MTGISCDVVVIGAGVVGIALARALALRGRQVIVLERHAHFGMETSSRNSEVIHAGIYYPGGSLKAQCCVEGREALYRYCASKGIPCRRCGKLIVATNEAQCAQLESIQKQGLENGAGDLRWLSSAELRNRWPELNAQAAVHSPETGIIDSHALMLSLKQDAEAEGAQFCFCHEVLGGDFTSLCPLLDVRAPDGSRFTLAPALIVNAGGLGATQWLKSSRGFPLGSLPTPVYVKGSYFTYTGKVPFGQLVYPVPEAGGLGIHLTLDLAGQARFGPDTEWLGVEDETLVDYEVSPEKKAAFVRSIQRYWPAVSEDRLQPGYSGVRPKIRMADQICPDFMIQDERVHGVSGLINLFGIESPGLTSALAIASRVARAT